MDLSYVSIFLQGVMCGMFVMIMLNTKRKRNSEETSTAGYNHVNESVANSDEIPEIDRGNADGAHVDESVTVQTTLNDVDTSIPFSSDQTNLKSNSKSKVVESTIREINEPEEVS